MPVGSAEENYLRYAQTLGLVPLSEWAIRPLAPSAIELLSGPTELAYLQGNRPARQIGSLSWQVIPVSASAWYNTTYPFGWNDGAVWRGRGLTAALEGGFWANWKWLSATIDPVAFLAENRAFPLLTPPAYSVTQFSDPIRPDVIDRPQRFGARTYGQLNGGQSTIRVDALGFALGVSTADQWVGPMSEWPFLLSNNAAGIPHAFIGSSRPWNVWVGTIHGKLFYGGLTQSAYVGVPDTVAGRFTTGVMGSFMPRFLPGLELGAGRLFATSWPAGGVGWPQLRKPFEAFLKQSVKGDPGLDANSGADNQLVSLFARWVMPGSGFEAYAEYGREDHNWNSRDAIAEPDNNSTYGLGLRKAWKRSEGALSGLRAEILNFDPSTLARARGQGGIYTHGRTRQGHTQMGQVLGAGFAAIDGGGSMLAIENFSKRGEKSAITLMRLVTHERSTNQPNVDVQYALSGERTRRVGSVGITYGITTVYELNRYFSADVGNVMVTTSLRW